MSSDPSVRASLSDSDSDAPARSQEAPSQSQRDPGSTIPEPIPVIIPVIPGDAPADEPPAREGDERSRNASIQPLVLPPFRRDTWQILHLPLRMPVLDRPSGMLSASAALSGKMRSGAHPVIHPGCHLLFAPQQ